VIGRILRTIRYLQWSQIVGQVQHRLARRRGIAAKRPAPPVSLRGVVRRWQNGVQKYAKLSGESEFRCLNKTYAFPAASDWDRSDQLFLWKYNLHYFDFLNSGGSRQHVIWARNLVERWIEEHVRGIGWDPYPTSLRLVNWVRHHLEEVPLPPSAIESLASQAAVLARSIEHHLGANHLFTNAKALVFAGYFFTGRDAEKWRVKGMQILRRELSRQFLADGGHYERSPMYQAILVEDLLDLVNLFQTYQLPEDDAFQPTLSATAQRGLQWLCDMGTGHDSFPLFGDSVYQIAPTVAALMEYADGLGVSRPVPRFRSVHLASSGFLRLERDPGIVMFASVDGPKPEHQPGHSHADTFGFELFIAGRPVLVDSGIPTYERSASRALSRSTAAHNTLQIGAMDSSEVWASFRVGRRARVGRVRWDPADSVDTFSAVHDGYRFLRGSPKHERTWRVMQGEFEIVDSLDTDHPHDVAIRFRAAPGLRWKQVSRTIWTLEGEGLQLLTIQGDDLLSYRTERGVHHREFNMEEAVHVLTAMGRLERHQHVRHRIAVSITAPDTQPLNDAIAEPFGSQLRSA
jgi:uncharacterized heparinase superfamily protein